MDAEDTLAFIVPNIFHQSFSLLDKRIAACMLFVPSKWMFDSGPWGGSVSSIAYISCYACRCFSA